MKESLPNTDVKQTKILVIGTFWNESGSYVVHESQKRRANSSCEANSQRLAHGMCRKLCALLLILCQPVTVEIISKNWTFIDKQFIWVRHNFFILMLRLSYQERTRRTNWNGFWYNTGSDFAALLLHDVCQICQCFSTINHIIVPFNLYFLSGNQSSDEDTGKMEDHRSNKMQLWQVSLRIPYAMYNWIKMDLFVSKLKS